MRDPFEFDDYFTQDYIATVDSVKFVENDFGVLQAVFTNRYDEPILGDDGELRTERPQFYNVGQGKDWEATGGGTGFAHKSGDPDKRIRSNSAFGELLIRVVDLVGKEQILTRSGGNLYSESTFVGLRFHWVTEGAGKPYSLKDKVTGETKTGTSRGREMPVEYLPGGSLPVVDSFDVDALGLDEATVSDLMTMATGFGFGEFQSKALSLVRDLQDDDQRASLQRALSQQSFYETLRA